MRRGRIRRRGTPPCSGSAIRRPLAGPGDRKSLRCRAGRASVHHWRGQQKRDEWIDRLEQFGSRAPFLEQTTSDGGQESDPDLRILGVKKSNDGPTGLPIRLRWRNGAFVLAEPDGGFDKLAANAKADRDLPRLARGVRAPGKTRLAQAQQCLCACGVRKHPGAEGVSKKAFERRWKACSPPAAYEWTR